MRRQCVALPGGAGITPAPACTYLLFIDRFMNSTLYDASLGATRISVAGHTNIGKL